MLPLRSLPLGGPRRLDPPYTLDERLDRQLGECRRSHQPLGLLSLAIDRIAGADGPASPAQQEAVMVEIGQRLHGRLRSTDHVLWQGEREFVVTLPGARRDGVQAVQQRLTQHLGGAYRIGQDLLMVTVQVGSACYPAAGTSAAALLATAQASRQGPEGLRRARR